MTTQTKIAFLGTGLMGAPMACNLLKAGFAVAVYNRTRSKTAPVVEAGGSAHATPAEAAQKANVVISCVTDGPDVERVYFGDDGAVNTAPAGALFIDMSTIAPAKAIEIGNTLRERGFRFLEAPVTGGTIGAQNGTLSILAAGEKSDFDEASAVFSAMGKNVTFCGGPGAGQSVKLCNQIMGAMNLLGVCEALILCQKMGVQGEVLVQALNGGAATSWALQNLAPKILKGDFAPGFMVDTQQKDMRLVADAGEEVNAVLPGAALAQQLWRAAQAHGEGADGIQAMYKVLSRLSELKQ
jgi:3-hydroxyisobutyrate dehydrogenase